MEQEKPFSNPLKEVAEEIRDQKFIEDNLKLFWGVAKGASQRGEKGAIYIEAESWERDGAFDYVGVEAVHDHEVQELIRTADPDFQIVVIIKKSAKITASGQDLSSAYRVTVDPNKSTESDDYQVL